MRTSPTSHTIKMITALAASTMAIAVSAPRAYSQPPDIQDRLLDAAAAAQNDFPKGKCRRYEQLP